jgi:hypothetical protein
MNVRRHSVVNVLTTGVVVLIFVSLALFWTRWFCGNARQGLLDEWGILDLTARPSRLFPAELEGDPNVVQPSCVYAELIPDEPYVMSLGINRPPLYRLPQQPSPWVYWMDSERDGGRVYYDKSLGLMVYSDTERIRQPDGDYVRRRVATYAGPDGIAEKPNDKLGRFSDPVAGPVRQPWVVYDRKLRRFCAIDWYGKTVRKGPQLPKDTYVEPVEIGWSRLGKNRSCIKLSFSGPTVSDESGGHRRAAYSFGYDPMKAFVLNASGRIDLLDVESLEIVGRAGVLPAPDTLLPGKERVTPKDVLAYDLYPVFVGEGEDLTYAGCAVASVSREATAMTLHVFDPNGKRVSREATGLGPGARRDTDSSAHAAYFGLPGAPLLTGLKYIVENLHPPVLLFLSYATASCFEASAGYRAIFILPESFPAMAGRNMSAGPSGRFLSALGLMTLSLGLAGLLAGKVACDCARVGVSRRGRLLWVVAIMLFGLSAYLTYRLTRPQTTLVTCDNCGRRRRPDMDKCHRCGSPWQVPELTPPAWRVLDEAQLTVEAAPGAVEQQASTEQ